MPPLTRRHFLLGMSGLGVTTISTRSIGHIPLLIGAPKGTIRFGYAAITWDGNDALAIEEISQLGFPGIQLRSNILKEYGERPQALRDLLKQNKLEMVAFSSGGVRIDPGIETDEITKKQFDEVELSKLPQLNYGLEKTPRLSASWSLQLLR